MASILPQANFALKDAGCGELNVALNAAAVSFALRAGHGARFPDQNFVVHVDDETMLVGTRVGDTFNAVTRGLLGSGAAPHGPRACVYQMADEALIARIISNLENHAHPAGDIVGLPAAPAPNYRTLIELAADVANATTAFANVTGLSFPVLAGVNYRFKGLIVYTPNAATTGIRVSLTGPANPTLLAYAVGSFLSNVGGAANRWDNAQNTYDAGTVSTGALAGTNILEIIGFIRPSANGTLQLRFASEVAVANGIIIRAGSTLERW